MRDKVIPVIFSTDDNYVAYLSVVITSLKCNRGTDSYAVYILCESLNSKSQEILKALEDEYISISIISIKNNIFAEGYEVSHISKAMYYRLMIPEVLPEYKKVIYLDCDVIVKSPLSELYTIEMHENWVAGAVDYPDIILKQYVEETLMLDSARYINSGVLVIDNEKFYKNSVAQKCLRLLNKRRDFLYPDQDAINTVCCGHIEYLSNQWNMQSFKKNTELLPQYREKFLSAYNRPKIIHYSTHLKPWKWLNVNYSNEWYRYTNLKYYYDKKYYKMVFANMPVMNCGFIKRLLKMIKIQIWRS